MQLTVRCPVLILLSISFALISGIARADEPPITIKSMLQDMVNRDRLASWPKIEYRCTGFSSYDRASVSPDKPGWFANHDYDQFIRREDNNGRSEQVLMDTAGPGAIVRFWNAAGHDGTLRFYLDENSKPAIETPVDDLLGGTGIAGKPFSYILPATPLHGQEDYLARNLFFPIPYATHCKVTWDGKQKLFFYNINCLTFAPGTTVETFSTDRLKAYQADVRSVADILSTRALPANLSKATQSSVAIASEQSATIFTKSDGPGALRELRITAQAADLQQALRSTILQISFDDQPCVWCPIGAFFGTGYDIYPHTTWYTHVDENGTMECLWTMPFAKSVEVKAINLGTQHVRLSAEISSGSWAWDDQSMHFNACWRQTTHFKGPPIDFNYVTIHGKGVLVGDSLDVFNNYPNWWGEGDEKIYLDGEAFPSTFGTGTEDYYGYSWCRPNFFELPWGALPTARGNKRGGTSVNDRYRLLDAVPFKKSLSLNMEIWLPFYKQGQTVNFSPATFFYAMPGTTCEPQPDPGTARLPVPTSLREFKTQLDSTPATKP